MITFIVTGHRRMYEPIFNQNLKKMKKLLNLNFLLLMSILFISCSQNENQALENPQAVSVENQRLAANVNYRNPENPRDAVGHIHNQVLRDFSERKLRDDLSYDEVIAIIREIILLRQEQLDEYGIQDLEFNKTFIQQAYADYDNMYANVINNSQLSPAAKAYTQEIVNLTFDNSVDYPDFIEGVKVRENELIATHQWNSQVISENEYVLLLDFSSISRHSAALWLSEKNIDGDKKKMSKKTRGWIIVGADVLGGVFGGFAGVGYASGGAYYLTAGFDMIME